MIIRKQEWKKCGECGRGELIKDKSYGCDNCQKEIDLYEDQNYLRSTMFFHRSEAVDMQFCSWVCLFEKLRTVKTDYFIDLPMLTFDGKKVNGCSASDFWKAAYELRGEK